MAGPRCPPPPSRAGEGGRSGGHTERGRRGRLPAPPAVTITRLHAAAAAAAAAPLTPLRTTTSGQSSPPPAARRGPPPRRTWSHPQGEENPRSPSLGVKLQHGFRFRRSSPSPYSGSSNLLPFSRLPPDCAAAIPEGALQAWRAPDPLRVPAPRACQAGAGGGTAWDPKRLGFSADPRPAAAAGRLKRDGVP
nr:uncharacterized protein LOC129135347 isoform X3 [Pan troglodytes]